MVFIRRKKMDPKTALASKEKDSDEINKVFVQSSDEIDNKSHNDEMDDKLMLGIGVNDSKMSTIREDCEFITATIVSKLQHGNNLKNKSQKPKRFSLDNMLPTLEANLNINRDDGSQADVVCETAPVSITFPLFSKRSSPKNSSNNEKKADISITCAPDTTQTGLNCPTPDKIIKVYEIDKESESVNESESNQSVISIEPGSNNQEDQGKLDASSAESKPKPKRRRGPKKPLTAVSYKDKHVDIEAFKMVEFAMPEPTDDSMSTPMTSKMDRPYICPICQASFRQAFPLKRHMLIHSAVKPFACPHCDFRCNDGSNLRKHVATHNTTGPKRLKCPDCNYTCSRPDHLRHHRAKHTGHYAFVCGACGYGCHQACDMKRHMLVHTADKLFTCEICGFSTNRRSTLSTHTQTRHSDHRPFICGICNFTPTTKLGLKKHMLIHTGEKPYACSKCDYRTADRSCLVRHQIVHTRVKNEQRRYQCPYCERSCHQRTDMVKHCLRKHKTSNIEGPKVEGGEHKEDSSPDVEALDNCDSSDSQDLKPDAELETEMV